MGIAPFLVGSSVPGRACLRGKVGHADVRRGNLPTDRRTC
jgi:hypothetical protein